MRCLIWAAVSTTPQASDEKDSIPSQIEVARELLQRNDGWQEVHDPLIIPGHSRSYIFLADAAAEMPMYTDLMQLARSGSIDLLICRGRDRLGRTDALIAQVEEYLASYNVQILSLSMPTTIQDPEEFAEQRDRSAIWMRSVERARAQDEVAEIKARHRTGMRRRARDGYHANNLPFGYRLGPERIGVIHESEGAVVRQMFDWLLAGYSISRIKQRLPSVATGRYPRSRYGIKYVLRNPYYMGLIGYHRVDESGHNFRDRSEWITGPGLHEPIIPEQTWEAAQLELDGRENGHRTYSCYPLAGSVYCGYCQRPMTASVTSSGRHEYRYFVCRTARSDCARHDARNTVNMDQLDQVALAWLQERMTSPELLLEDLATFWGDQTEADQQKEADLQRARESKHDALQRWTRDYEEGLLGRYEYYDHRRRLEDEIASLDEHLEAIRVRRTRFDPEVVSSVLEDILAPGMEHLKAHWHQRETANQVRVLLRRIGFRIDVYADKRTLALSPPP